VTSSNGIFDFIVGVLAFVGWLYMTVEYYRAAKRGSFSVWRRKAGGATWPPVRAESPIKFWIYWAVMAWPYLIGSIVLIGIAFVTVFA
jgi:hypothetical protein